ncbi:MAG: chemotaxis protein CheA [Thermodesulfobacteriota bacterium]
MNNTKGLNNTFYEEAKTLVNEIESLVLDLESEPSSIDLVDSLFRAVHTLKGNSSMFGFKRAGDLAHVMENVIGQIKSRSIEADNDIIELLLKSADTLKKEFDNKGIDKKSFESVKDDFDKYCSESLFVPDQKTNEVFFEKKSREYKIFFRPMQEIFEIGLDPVVNIEELYEAGNVELTINTDDIPDIFNINPEKSYFSFDIKITTDHGLNDLKEIFIFVEDESEIEIEEVTAETSFENKQPFDVSQKINKYIDKEESSISIPTKKLDDLVNLVGELSMNQSKLMLEASEKDFLKDLADEMKDAVDQLRTSVLDLRMIPVGNKFSNFKRIVRDLSASLGKKVELYTFGGETQLDKSIIEKIWEPFVHLIRNSIDHGLEYPEERIKLGKSETGKIILSAKTKDSRVEIKISDDGKGVDKQKVYDAALERKIIRENQDLSDQDIFDLVFMPGFSTSPTISDLSGRGFGMDAVKKKIEEVSGDIKLDSEKGSGASVTVSLPLTLAIVDVLLCQSGGICFAFPLSQIEECIDFYSKNVEEGEGLKKIKVNENYIYCFGLTEIFNLPEESGEEPKQLVIYSFKNKKIGIILDELIRTDQVIIKSIRHWYKKNNGIAGASLLYNGELAYILDPGIIASLSFEAESKTI